MKVGRKLGVVNFLQRMNWTTKKSRKGKKVHQEAEISPMDNHKHYIGKWGWWKYQNDLFENQISDRIRQIWGIGDVDMIRGTRVFWRLRKVSCLINVSSRLQTLVEPDNNNLVEVVYSVHVILCLIYCFYF